MKGIEKMRKELIIITDDLAEYSSIRSLVGTSKYQISLKSCDEIIEYIDRTTLSVEIVIYILSDSPLSDCEDLGTLAEVQSKGIETIIMVENIPDDDDSLEYVNDSKLSIIKRPTKNSDLITIFALLESETEESDEEEYNAESVE